jgi:hypothetical protein
LATWPARPNTPTRRDSLTAAASTTAGYLLSVVVWTIGEIYRLAPKMRPADLDRLGYSARDLGLAR